MPDIPQNRNVPLTVSQFIELTGAYLATLTVAVQGEVVDFHTAKDRLVFFDLKDAKSRMTCFMLVWELSYPLEDGMEVEVTGSAGLFKASGKFHFRVASFVPKGVGALSKALEATKNKLEAEGLFAAEFKQSLPLYPAHIALITSPDAAAYTDVMRVLSNRWPGLTVTFLPTGVQGPEAAGQITAALQYANAHTHAETIILTRGGGSLEDLSAFNAESVARAIFASRIPVVCGIGHERDWTIADLVADIRAATPSNAAELTVPDAKAVTAAIMRLADNIIGALHVSVKSNRRRVQECVRTLDLAMKNHLEDLRTHIRRFAHSSQKYTERSRSVRLHVDEVIERCFQATLHRTHSLAAYVVSAERLFRTQHPEMVLSRGYSITFDKTGKIIKDVHTLALGDVLTTRISHGAVESTIKRLYAAKKRKDKLFKTSGRT